MRGAVFACVFLFFFNDTATTEIYTLSLHDALPISQLRLCVIGQRRRGRTESAACGRSEEYTSELQSRFGISYAVFCLKKKKDTHRPLHPLIHELTALAVDDQHCS